MSFSSTRAPRSKSWVVLYNVGSRTVRVISTLFKGLLLRIVIRWSLNRVKASLCVTWITDFFLPDLNVPHQHCCEQKSRTFSPRSKLGRISNDFEGSTFPRFVAQIEYSRPWKVLENPHVIFCSSFQNLRLGGVNFILWKKCCFGFWIGFWIRYYTNEQLMILRLTRNGSCLIIIIWKCMLPKRRFWKD